jgi:ABC-type sugar transport system substrate-binding protein
VAKAHEPSADWAKGHSSYFQIHGGAVPNLLPLHMKSWKNKFAVLVTLGLSAFSSKEKALATVNKDTIALIPGLTIDAFYIAMRKGAETAAKALGVDLIFQGTADFNPVTQVGA